MGATDGYELDPTWVELMAAQLTVEELEDPDAAELYVVQFGAEQVAAWLAEARATVERLEATR